MQKLSFSRKSGSLAAAAIFSTAVSFAGPAAAQNPPSLDYGPFTPEANSAYMGGGVVIEHPGRPAPQYSYSAVAQPYYSSPPAAYAQPNPAGYYAPAVPYARPYYPAAAYPYAPAYFCRWPGFC